MHERIFLVCLIACGEAGETHARPRAPQRGAAASIVAPDPEGAFAGPAAEAARDDRFATRRIGDATSARRYTGAPVDLDVKSADVHDVFRLLADVGRVNIVVAGEITGTITLRLTHVPWDQALDVVLETRSLVASREGNVIVVRAR